MRMIVFPGECSKMKTVSARIPEHTHAALNILIKVGMFESLSDAVRSIIEIGMEQVRPHCPGLVEYTKKVKAFDNRHFAAHGDMEKIRELVKEIDQLAEELEKNGLAWTLFDIAKAESDLLGIAREDLWELDS